MKRLTTSIFLISTLISALCVTTASYAGPSVELRVTGTIRPSACTPTLGNGGAADYGTIPSASLGAGQFKTLEVKQVSLTVTCDAAAKIAIVTLDNRSTSRVANIADGIRSGAGYNFGLGSVAGKNIGGYVMSFANNATADGKLVSSIASQDKGNIWSANDGAITHAGTYFSFSQDGATPLALKTLSTTINVQAILNKPENLPLNQDIRLDGSATIEIQYL